MLLAVQKTISAAVLAARSDEADIFGVVDLTNGAETRISNITLGLAIQFVANATILGYDVRAAMVFYGEPGTPSLRSRDCDRLWAQLGGALVRP